MSTTETIETSTGTTITLRPGGDGDLVILANPNAPEDLREFEAGRLVVMASGLAFQPAPFFPACMSVEVLRGIAHLIEGSTR